MINWKDYLPDLKGALAGFYDENVKETIETKTEEFKSLIQNNIVVGQRTQKALIAIALGVFFLLLIAYFWKDDQKYLVLGILTSYLTVYIYHLTNPKRF
jgi:hypothetical protein